MRQQRSRGNGPGRADRGGPARHLPGVLLALVLALPATAQEAASQPAAGPQPGWQLQLGAGRFDVSPRRRDEPAELAALQLALGPRKAGLRPVVGFGRTSDEGRYVYLGALRDFDLGARWTLTPQFAASWFEPGDGLDLGHELEFLSSLQRALRLGQRSHLGLAVQHLSNAGLSDDNPGAENVLVTWRWRFGAASPR